MLPDQKPVIQPKEGKLGVLLPGMGAVSTTFITGILAARKNLGQLYGSLTQMGTIRLGKRTDKTSPLIKDFLPLADIDQLVFGGWDVFSDNMYEAAIKAGVLEQPLLDQLKDELSEIKPWKGVFFPEYVKKLNGHYIKKAANKWNHAQLLREDIQQFKEQNNLARLVAVWCGSTEIYLEQRPVHKTLKAFENGLKKNDPAISPSMIYAYAHLQEGVPYANGAPNLAVDLPALYELASEKQVPIAGKDFKTGQTLMKTILAPGIKARLLGLNGWFSTNILGNRDGEVLDDPESFRTKEVSKLGALEYILQPDLYPQLYGNFIHQVRINYYPPRGDNKEGWDNLDIFGWLGYPMQIKLNFLCRDSILAAPIVLDLAIFLDLAKRAGFSGIQEWLSFYFKSPMHSPKLYPEHDIFIQLMKLKNTLRYIGGENQITHLGLDYYNYYQS
jgi:myo-inositol-1-phosphate synthase